MNDRLLPSYILVDGFRLPVAFYPPAFRDALQYQPGPDDVFLATYPKCGSTWMQYILYLIYNKGKPPDSFIALQATCTHLEMLGVEAIDHMKRPGAIKTHLPFHMTPYSPDSKYICIFRNPKDCCLSYYHHTECTGGMYDFEGGEFNDYFEIFIKGEVDFGDYFDHLLSWYEHRNESNILMLTYEEMKADIRSVISKVAKFLGDDYGKYLEKNNEVLDAILVNSSAEKMKVDSDNFMKKMAEESKSKAVLENIIPAMKHLNAKLAQHKSSSNPRYKIVRKGIVGSWRNVFTPEQNRRMDEVIENRLAGTEILKFWKEIGAI